MQEIRFNPPSGKAIASFSYNQDDKMFVDFIQKRITLFIPFEGDEKKCWDCGGDREIIVRLSLNGDFIGFDECCNLPTEQLVEAFHAD